VAEETAAHAEEIRLTLARERADMISQLATEERRLSAERLATYSERERRASEALADMLGATERRLDERLQGIADDLDRAGRHLEAQMGRLSQRQQQGFAEVEARIEREAAELGSTSDEQRLAVIRLREELERAAATAVTEALDELEAQTIERRRAIDEITERLRAREAAIAEGVEQAETDARARLELTLVEFERRQTERLERVTEREIERHAQIAAMAYDERMREIREDAATRLARELDRAVEVVLRDDLARRLETE
jgi:electron transport complex protein RnfC